MVIRKSTGLFTPVNMFRLSLLSVSLTQVLNSLRSPKKSDHNAVKFSYELNFRHSRFISHLFTIHSQGLLHFTPHGIHSNHDSWNRFFFFFIKSRFTVHKKTGSQSPHWGQIFTKLWKELNQPIKRHHLLYISSFKGKCYLLEQYHQYQHVKKKNDDMTYISILPTWILAVSRVSKTKSKHYFERAWPKEAGNSAG